jgi:chromosome segregation ATPase
MSDEAKAQPTPRPGREEVHPRVVAFLNERAAFGRRKYDRPLETHNGRDPLIDLMQELGDALEYAMQEYMQRTDAYREGYEAGQKAGLIFGSSQPDLASLQNAERCGYANGEAAGIRATEEKCERVNRELRESLDKRDAAIRALHQEAEERIHEGATRATECDAWRDKCGALEEALKVADSRALDLENRLATAQKQARIDERHLRECLARTEQERYQAACERNRAEAELRTLREKLAALLNEKA